MIWIVRCSLRTYLSYSLTSSILHAVPELVQDKKDFIYLHTARKRGSFIWSYWVNIDVSLKEEKAFSINLPDEKQIKEAFIIEGRGHSPTHLKFFLLVFSKLKEDIK